MNIKNILHKVDHTELNPAATWQDIKRVCDEGVEYNTATVCIPLSYVKKAAEYLKGKQKICTVIGFPTGYSTTECKCFEAKTAVKMGADEVDMVINLGWLKEKRYQDILNEINRVKDSCGGKCLKVIIETCMLEDFEKIKMCEIISRSKADFIKTSTGFSKCGATKEDIQLFAKYLSKDKQIKAAGGISNFKDAEDFIKLGADRLGTSRLVKIIKGCE